ncbi:MAG: aminoglycoside phosphotransferase family protein [Clostridia bacterium]|nr:aminoglycoside phosphotransferase family protein [Clostridia bacterium]
MKGYDYKELCSKFAYKGDYIGARIYGEGHINETLLIETTGRRYILQRVNSDVFKEPVHVIDNVVAVTEYLHNRIISNFGDPYRETLTLIPAKDGTYYHQTEQGDVFRMYLFIDNARSYQSIENPEMFYRVAKTFGHFQTLLKAFPAEKLHETIPKFHDTVDRYRLFKEAIEKDRVGRRSEVQKEINFFLEREKEAALVVDAIKTGEIPLRVTHNDTKLNNVLIDDATGEGVCVIDLDTVMPGSMLYDFGDSIRFGASTATEDETDLSKVWMNLELFEQYTKGYIEELKSSFTPKEVELLAFSAKLMTLECGMRFLTDHLNGDVYFRIHKKNHNLDRARTHIKLVTDMETKMERMNEIVYQYYNAQ